MGSVPGMDGHVLRGAQKNAEEASGCVSWTMSPGPSQSLPLNVWYSPSQWPGMRRTGHQLSPLHVPHDGGTQQSSIRCLGTSAVLCSRFI